MKLKILITNQCNMKCKKCSHHLQTPNDFHTALLTKVDCPMERIAITGGEPTTRQDLPEIIERLSQNGNIALYSNLLELNAQKLKSYISRGLRSVMGWIDTDDKEDYLHNTGVDGFNQVLRHIRILNDSGIEFVLNTVVNERNSFRIQRIIDLAIENGTRIFSFNRMIPQQSLPQFKTVELEQFRILREEAIRYVLSRGMQCNVQRGVQHCDAAFHVAVNGDVYLCSMQHTLLGSLRQENLSVLISNFSPLNSMGQRTEYCGSCNYRI